MLKPLYHLSLLFVVITASCTAQDVILSQPYANQVYLNPAFTGSSDAHRLNMNYRYQWGGDYTTGMLSYDQNIVDSANGIGLLAEMDNAGKDFVSTTSATALYAHNFHFGKSFWLSAGAKGGIISTKFNETLRFPDGTTQSVNQPNIVGDFSAGVLGYGKHYYVGLAVDHIAEPKQNIDPVLSGDIDRRYTLNAGGMINIPNFTISPNILFEYQGGTIATDFGLYGIIKNIVQVGVWYRSSAVLTSFMFVAGLQFKYFHVGYSYDIGTGPEEPGAAGSAFVYTHEFSLALLLPSKTVHSNKLNCPNF